MWRIVAILSLAVVAASAAEPKSMKKDLVFLTRDGCVNTPDVANNLDAALRAMKLPLDYQSLDIGTLPKMDPRTGYPTPTVLWKGTDIFGMPVPVAPFPEPS